MIPIIIIGIIYKSIPSAGGSCRPVDDDDDMGLHSAAVVALMVKENVINIVL